MKKIFYVPFMASPESAREAEIIHTYKSEGITYHMIKDKNSPPFVIQGNDILNEEDAQKIAKISKIKNNIFELEKELIEMRKKL